MASSDDFGVNPDRETKVRTGNDHYARSPIPRYAVRRCGSHTRYWHRVTGTHPIAHLVPLRKNARSHESSGPHPPAGNGLPIGRRAGQQHTGGNGGLTSDGFRRRRSRRTT